MGRECRLYLGFFSNLDWGSLLHGQQSAQVSERDNRGSFTAQVNHLIRFVWVEIAPGRRGHVATVQVSVIGGCATAGRGRWRVAGAADATQAPRSRGW
jgi:hypothetical protein